MEDKIDKLINDAKSNRIMSDNKILTPEEYYKSVGVEIKLPKEPNIGDFMSKDVQDFGGYSKALKRYSNVLKRKVDEYKHMNILYAQYYHKEMVKEELVKFTEWGGFDNGEPAIDIVEGYLTQQTNEITDKDILKIDFYDFCGTGAVSMTDEEKISYYRNLTQSNENK